jgi:hypothetical protein
MGKSPDPTKDPEFQAVVQHFLKTPPKPHKPPKKKQSKKRKAAKKATNRA